MVDLSAIVGESAPIVALRDQVARFLEPLSGVRRVPPVLILGETGTGKGLLARTLQRAGPRANGPFVEVNCAAIPENLLESEMFGHERGAFTDARAAKPGLFQTAHGGTLFLDEVGLLPESLQGKLLKVLQDQVVRRVGGTRNEPADVWILAATNADLSAAVRERKFREDLYHRLAVFVFELPPLRERANDVLRLAEHFVARSCRDYGLTLKTLSPPARKALLEERWPGNAHQLGNVIERAVLLSRTDVLEAEALELRAGAAAVATATGEDTTIRSLGDALARDERQHLSVALDRFDWNITRTAAALGISRDTLRYRIEKLGLAPGEERLRARHTKRPGRLRVADESVRPSSKPVAPTPAPEPARRRAIAWRQRRIAIVRVVLDRPLDLDVFVEKIEGLGGRVEELGESGLLAVFGLEVVEDAVQRAAHAALAIRNALAYATHPGAARECRIAIHASLLPVGENASGPFIALDAKRLAWVAAEALVAASDPGTIVVGDGAVTSLLNRFDVEPLASPAGPGAYVLAGHAAPTAGGRQRATPFVGRDRELTPLRAALSAVLDGRGQSIGLVGEAGIGKSRLITEFSEHLAGYGVDGLHARCVSHGGGTPFLPLVAMLRSAFDVEETDDPLIVRDKVTSQLAGHAATVATPILYLLGDAAAAAELAALSPEIVRQQIFDALLTFTLERERALFLVVEDLHWIDNASEAWLTLLAEQVMRHPVVLLCSYRPGYRPPWMSRSDATQIAVRPLTSDESRSAIATLMPAGAAPRLVEQIIHRAEGNPFFLEQLARGVGERSADAEQVPVPASIHDVLQARIDRLADEPRHLIDAAAVLGRAAPAALLRAMWDGAGAPDSHLRELARLELLYEEGRGESTTYVFRHALLQDVAYQALPASRRRGLHRAAATTIETVHVDRLDEMADQLAHHWSCADVADKAAEHFCRLAERATRIYAHAEAVSAWRQAREHVERGGSDDGDRRALALMLREAYSLNFLGRFPELIALLEAHRGRLDRVDDPALNGMYHFWLAHSWTLRGNPDLVARHGQRALAEATRAADDATIGKARYALAYECFWSGRPREGIAQASEARRHLEAGGESWWTGHASWLLAINHMFAGEFAAALAALRRTREIGDAIGDPRLRSIGLSTTGACHILMGDWERGIAACEEGLALSPDPVNASATTGFLAAGYLEQGDVEKAIPTLARAVELCTAVGVHQTAAWYTALLGEALALNGEIDRARPLVRSALETLTTTRYAYGIAVAQRAMGRVALLDHDLAQARQWLEQAVGSFAAAGAPYDVARTYLDVARLSVAEGRREEAAVRLREALSTLEALDVPRYVDRCRKLAVELGVGPL